MPWWDGKIKLFKNNELPAGLFWATKRQIEQETDIRFKIEPDLEKSIFLPKDQGLVSEDNWQFQNDCVDAMVKVARYGGGTIVGATGSGKTRIASMFASRLQGNLVFIVDQLMLLEQAKKDFEQELGETIGYVGKSEFSPKRVTIATRQTMFLHRKDREFIRWTQQLDAMIIDEIHEQMNKSNFALIEAIMPKAVYGLTATLQLRKQNIKVKVSSLTGPKIFDYPLIQGQADNVLAKGVAVRILFPNPISKSDQKYYGWAQLYRESIVENRARNWLVAELVEEAERRGYYTVVLVTRIQHLKEISRKLQKLKIAHRIVAGTYDGSSVKIEDRMASKDDFEQGKVKVIVANTVFKKGINIKRLDFIIDAAANRSEDDAIQKFGRGLRQHKDKKGLLFFDIADQDSNKKNWFRTSSNDRKKAYLRQGIKVKQTKWWNYPGQIERIIDNAELWLEES